MKHVRSLTLLAALSAAVLPRIARAWSWVPAETAALKSRLVEFARENGHAAFAEKIAAEEDLTSWIAETVEYAEKGLARCEGADWRDARRHALLRLVDYPTHVDSFSADTPAEVRDAWSAATDVIITPVWNFPSNVVKRCMANPAFDRNTALFLPSHFNELGHGVGNRESYWEAYWREDRLSTPGMVWPRTQILYLGESVIWKRDLSGDAGCAGTLKHRRLP